MGFIATERAAVLEFLKEHQEFVWPVAATSLVIFLASVFIIPAIVVRIRPDYFAHHKRPPNRWAESSVAVRTMILIAKNLLGILLLIAGFIMLALPGQGLLTILVGLLLINFPHKYRFERWLVSRGPILRSVNWLRRRAKQPPLTVRS